MFFVMMLILEERHVRTSQSVGGQGWGVGVDWVESSGIPSLPPCQSLAKYNALLAASYFDATN